MGLEFDQNKLFKRKRIQTASQSKTTKTPKYALVFSTETNEYTIMEASHARNKLMLYDNRLIDKKHDPADVESDKTYPVVVLAIASKSK